MITIQLLIAFWTDIILGDPRWLPHPVRLIGRYISFIEKILRWPVKSHLAERFAGVLLTLVVVITTYITVFFFTKLLNYISNDVLILSYLSLNDILIGIFGSLTISLNGLIRSVKEVITKMENTDILSARESLSRIVGRDTTNLNEEGILKASLETLSENTSDGIIAPMFYFAIGGLPLAFAYKAINTIDSMVGYKNSRYLHFGWAGARLDDLANYIPARITGFLIVAATFVLGVLKRAKVIHCNNQLSFHNSLKIMYRDGRKHLSPNAGFPEAAMAGAIGVILGGTSSYNDIPIQKPFIGENTKRINTESVLDSIKIAFTASVFGLILIILFDYYFFKILI